MKKIHLLPLVVIILVVIVFFRPYVFQGKLPIPADTIVGLYHPYRDLYAKNYPNGIPYKNSLITDPIRQQYPWKWLAITLEKNGILPLWNPYTMAGTPLLATLQGGVFYPLNFFFFLFPFFQGWSLFIFIQQILAGIFIYFYLHNLRLNRFAALLGGITYTFSGFSIAWLEWGTIGHTALWMPLVLLAIDKISISYNSEIKTQKSKLQLKNQKYLWSFIYIFSLASSFFAGHLQTFFYLFILSVIYLLARWWQFGRKKRMFYLFLLLNFCFLILTAVQWLPTLQLINLSARDVDQIGNFQKVGWFIPWQQLIQFVIPDFFGNPTTINYWGVWNYGEFVGYVGIFPLIISLYALFHRYDKRTFFFGSLFFLSLLFALPTFFAKIPYILQIPFISTAQPTRLLFLTDFSLAVLAALGLDLYIRSGKKKQIVSSVFFVAIIFLGLWGFIFYATSLTYHISVEDLFVAKRNLYFPTLIFALTTAVLIVALFIKNKKIITGLIILLLLISMIDLLRFSQKFTPFTEKEYLYPPTTILNYLQKQKGQFRIMTNDERIFPPNFSVMYHLQMLDGYDPLYVRRYGEFIAAMERGKPDIHPPFGFNRIITPHTIDSSLVDFLGVRYVMSLSDINSPKYKKILTEGEIRLYENKNSFPRAFFVEKIKNAGDKKTAIQMMFNTNLKETAIVEGDSKFLASQKFAAGTVKLVMYSENKVIFQTDNNEIGYLVFVDTYYPTWHVKICIRDEIDCHQDQIHLTDYNFRGVVVPAGTHRIIFYNSLL